MLMGATIPGACDASPVRITAEDLHDAADLCGSFGDDETRIAEYGLTFKALQEFIDDSDWRDIGAQGPMRDLDPLALAIGISIGVIAAQPLPSIARG